MAMSGPPPSPGASDWLESVREQRRQSKAPPSQERVLESAHEAGEIDTPMLFAYFEGRLNEEERAEVEAQAAESPHLLSKMSRVARLLADRRGGLAGA